MEKPHTFYIIYRIDQDADVDGLHLLAGYYKYTYDLTGEEKSDPSCHFSADRYNWSECSLFNNLGEFQEFFEKIEPTPMKLEHEEYIETIHYRGMSVPIFCDDYGQCFYCILDNEIVSFGSFQPEYEDEVKHLIDWKIDEKKKK